MAERLKRQRQPGSSGGTTPTVFCGAVVVGIVVVGVAVVSVIAMVVVVAIAIRWAISTTVGLFVPRIDAFCAVKGARP